MPSLPTLFDQCRPRPEVLSGDLPDAIFAADLWEVIEGKAHEDYQIPARFFANSHPTESLSLLLKEVGERLAGAGGGTPVFRLETGFGGGKTHNLIAAVHLAREGSRLQSILADYGPSRLPEPGATKIAAFVGDQSDPQSGLMREEGGVQFRTYTPWGEIAYRLGGKAAYDEIRANDEPGGAPSRQALECIFGDAPVLILIDELVLYLARGLALPADHLRRHVVSQMPTFLQTLFTLAAQRPRTCVIFTLPTEQDANRRVTAEFKQVLPQLLGAVDEMAQTAGRQARNLTPTQSYERAAVLARRLFQSVDRSRAGDVADAYRQYYEAQRAAGVEIDNRAFEREYRVLLERSYPFHPELIRLFAERLAEINEFQSTRGALRLVARTIRAVWDNRQSFSTALLLQPHHVDLTRAELRDELLARLDRSAYRPALEADVVKAEGGAHAALVEEGWPARAATESALTVFLHSLPEGSRGLSAAEVAVAIGRPGFDLAYVRRGLEETEKRGWYMYREGERFLFRARASVNKRFQERAAHVTPPEIREQLDHWIQEVFSGFEALQVIPFPHDQTAIADTPDRVRLALIHYDTEAGYVGGGERLNFTRRLFETKGVDAVPRTYKNNLIFLLAEGTRIDGLKETVRALIAWERVHKDLETEQKLLAETLGLDHRGLKEGARRGSSGVPVEFLALDHDLGVIMEKLGPQELAVRTRLIEAYRVLACPPCGPGDNFGGLFDLGASQTALECYRVDFGESPQAGRSRRSGAGHETVGEAPILEALREIHKLAPAAQPDRPLVLDPKILRQSPLWQAGERRVSTLEIWERLRKQPNLPMVLRQTDLLPTLRAGLTAQPDTLWYYYDEAEKRVYTRETASELSPVLSQSHFLYDMRAAVQDRVMPVTQLSSADIWSYLWPREGGERAAKFSTDRLLEMARTSLQYPVLPGREVVWRALQDGARENRWVLMLRANDQVIGAQEMDEWPGLPRFDSGVELWQYQAALDANLYPRRTAHDHIAELLTAPTLKKKCWPGESPTITTEELERYARSPWPQLNRSTLEATLRDGVKSNHWGAWYAGQPEAFYLSGDSPAPSITVSADWRLVALDSQLARELDNLRPGRGPQPIEAVGTPREALTAIWNQLSPQRHIEIAQVSLTVDERTAFENTLLATWADRPLAARIEVTLKADGHREVDQRREVVSLEFNGRFEEVRALLAPIWPFARGGQLQIELTLTLSFDPAAALDEATLNAYRTALINANQGQLTARVVPVRQRLKKS